MELSNRIELVSYQACVLLGLCLIRPVSDRNCAQLQLHESDRDSVRLFSICVRLKLCPISIVSSRKI